MNYLKKHLIKLLLIPLLSGSNAGAMRGVAAARSAAGKSFGRTSTGRAADRALEPQSGTRTGAGSLTSRASIPAMKRDETLRQIAAQASGSASESSAFAAPSGEEKGRRRKVKFTKNLEVDAASILEAEVIDVLANMPQAQTVEGISEADKTLLFKQVGARLLDKAEAEKQQPSSITRDRVDAITQSVTKGNRRPDLRKLSVDFLKNPSSQPVIKKLIAENAFGLADLADGMKPVSDLEQKALTLVQEQNLVSQGLAEAQKFEANAFNLPLSELLKKQPRAIEKLFRKLALKLHPDKGGDAGKFQDLSHLKDLLLSPEGHALLKLGTHAFENKEIVNLFLQGKVPASEQLQLLIEQAAGNIPSKSSVLAITMPGESPSLSTVQEQVAQALGEKVVTAELLAALTKGIEHKAATAATSSAETQGSGQDKADSASAEQIPAEPQGPQATGPESQLQGIPALMPAPAEQENSSIPTVPVDNNNAGAQDTIIREDVAPQAIALAQPKPAKTEVVLPVIKTKKRVSKKLDLSKLLKEMDELIVNMKKTQTEIDAACIQFGATKA